MGRGRGVGQGKREGGAPLPPPAGTPRLAWRHAPPRRSCAAPPIGPSLPARGAGQSPAGARCAPATSPQHVATACRGSDGQRASRRGFPRVERVEREAKTCTRAQAPAAPPQSPPARPAAARAPRGRSVPRAATASLYAARAPPPPPLPRTNRTSLVPPLVLSGRFCAQAGPRRSGGRARAEAVSGASRRRAARALPSHWAPRAGSPCARPCRSARASCRPGREGQARCIAVVGGFRMGV